MLTINWRSESCTKFIFARDLLGEKNLCVITTKNGLNSKDNIAPLVDVNVINFKTIYSTKLYNINEYSKDSQYNHSYCE